MPERELTSFVEVHEDGTVSERWLSRFVTDLRAFAGSRVMIRAQRKRKLRSLAQNRYYWGVIVEAFRYGAEYTWGETISKDQAHETLKANCLFTEKVNESTGEVIRLVGTTTKNSTFNQEEYHDKCRAFIAEWFGMQVPLPNEQASLDFEFWRDNFAQNK